MAHRRHLRVTLLRGRRMEHHGKAASPSSVEHPFRWSRWSSIPRMLGIGGRRGGRRLGCGDAGRFDGGSEHPRGGLSGAARRAGPRVGRRAGDTGQHRGARQDLRRPDARDDHLGAGREGGRLHALEAARPFLQYALRRQRRLRRERQMPGLPARAQRRDREGHGPAHGGGRGGFFDGGRRQQLPAAGGRLASIPRVCRGRGDRLRGERRLLQRFFARCPRNRAARAPRANADARGGQGRDAHVDAGAGGPLDDPREARHQPSRRDQGHDRMRHATTRARSTSLRRSLGQLLDLGVAGYPSVIVTRSATGTTTIAPGRVDLVVSSMVERPVTIPGLTSCTSDADCTGGQTCQSDLTCK